MPSRNTIEIIVQGEDKASAVLNKVGNSLDTLGKISLGAVVGGVTAATAAIAGFGVKALQEFGTFQQGMTEVFTLLPGITEEAMTQMQEQVQYTANVFGILPNEVVPALYQALSAGVPQNNVFQFMDIAAKAAIGGVTTLETAVDGLTSVVNAYGSEVIDAGRASDIMFQTVLLGKTEFDELSRYLFNVIPTAASLGLAFEDVGAALATITAQGTPTSVATTQIRQLLVELQKPTTEVAKLFQEMSGKSFPDFIKEGGNLEQALKFISDGAAQSGTELAGLFGSVEALNAFLGLTGNNADTFSQMLDKVTNSAGATDAAFKTMTQTMQFQLNRLQSKVSNFFINIGRKLEPVASKVIEGVGDIISVFDDFFTGDMTEGGDFTGFAKTLFDALKPLKPILNEIERLFDGFFGALEAGIPFLDVLRVYINAILPPELLQPFDDFLQLISDIGNAIGTALAPIIEWVKNNIELKDVLIVIAGAIGTVILPAILGLISAFVSFAAPIAALIAGVSLLRQAWENDFLGIRTFITDKLLPALGDLANWFINDALPDIINFVQTVALPAIQTFFNWISGVWESIRPGLETLANWFLTDALPSVVSFIQTDVQPVLDTLVNLLKTIWDTVRPALTSLADWWLTGDGSQIIVFIRDNALVWINNFINTIRDIWRIVSPGLQSLFKWFSEKIPGIIKFVQDAIKVVQDLIALLSSLELNTGGSAEEAGRRLGGQFGSANGMDYVPYNQTRFLHRGEAVLTADENEARMNGGNTNTNNININLSGNYKNQSEANRDVDMMINALRLKGIDLSRA